MKKSLFILFFLAATFWFSKAEAATLKLNPVTKSLNSGESVSLTVNLDTQGQPADAIDLYTINFNPAVLEVIDADSQATGVQIKPGTLYPLTFVNSADNSSGKISFSQAVSAGTTGYTGTGILATIDLRAKANGYSDVTISFTNGSSTDSNVASLGVDILTSVTNSMITVGNVTPPPPPPPDSGLRLPEGAIVKTQSDPTVYLIEGGFKRPMTDWSVLKNYVSSYRPIVVVRAIDYPTGAILTLRSGTLVRSSANPTVYLITNNKKRPFSSEAEFLNAGYRFNMVYVINDTRLVDATETTTEAFVRPFGTMFKYASNPTIYFLNSRREKRAYTSINILRAWSDRLDTVITIPDSEVYSDGPIVTLPNGMLVKSTSSSTVYITYDNKLRAFTKAETFLNLGYQFQHIVAFPQQDLNLHQIGEVIN